REVRVRVGAAEMSVDTRKRSGGHAPNGGADRLPRITSKACPSAVASDRDRERAADLAHLVGPYRTHVTRQARPFDGLDMIEVDGGRALEPLVFPQHDLARCTTDRRGDGRDHDGVEEVDHILSRENENWALLVWRVEPVSPDLASLHFSGH